MPHAMQHAAIHRPASASVSGWYNNGGLLTMRMPRTHSYATLYGRMCGDWMKLAAVKRLACRMH
eukprot:335298-Chlamydomonas_euryale.AAC.6